MPKDDKITRNPFSAAQLDLADATFEDALAALERVTIGAHLNQNQRDLLVILAAQYEAEQAGKTVTFMVKEKFEINIGDHIGRSPGTVRNNLKAMDDLVHTPFIHNSKRDKVYKLTEKGYARYLNYKIGKAQLILDTADAIRNTKAPLETPYSSRMISLVAAAFLMFGGVSQAKASDTMAKANGLQPSLLWAHGPGDTVPGAGLPCAKAVPGASAVMGAIPITAYTTRLQMEPAILAPDPWAELADRKSMFDEHLPKLIAKNAQYPAFAVASYQ